MDCTLRDRNTIVFDNDLQISFQTTRLDYPNPNAVPDDFKIRPLIPITQYGSQLPSSITSKRGLLLPLSGEKEVCWIKFESTKPYLVKIYVGGVNAVSGLPAEEDSSVQLERQRRADNIRFRDDRGRIEVLQDYIIAPDQTWLRRHKLLDGTKSPFVVEFPNKSPSLGAYLTKAQSTGGLQIEVTPFDMTKHFNVCVKPTYPDKEKLWFTLRNGSTVENLMDLITPRFSGVKKYAQSLSTRFMDLSPHDTFDRNHLRHFLKSDKGSFINGWSYDKVIYLSSRARDIVRYGGFDSPKEVDEAEKYRAIRLDHHPSQQWIPKKTTVVNVQILHEDAIWGGESLTNPAGPLQPFRTVADLRPATTGDEAYYRDY